MIRLIALILVLVILGGLGLGLAIAYSDPITFATDVGFISLGTAAGGVVAIFVVNEVVSRRQTISNDEARRRLLRSIGLDAVGAIERVYGSGPGAGPPNALVFRGHRLSVAWHLYIETGRLNPKGFKTEVYAQHVNALHPKPGTTLLPRKVLTKMDLDIGLLMVTRALGRAYARIDLFEDEEPPIDDLEQASYLLKDGKDAGSLDDFQAASLMAALTEAVEKCGALLWQLGGFVDRDVPVDR